MSKIDWRTVAVGDVLKTPSGSLRVVRKVSAPFLTTRPNSVPERRCFLYFTISHCSWTGRGYTLYSVGELNGLGYSYTGIRVKFKSPLDLRINKKMMREGNYPASEFSCCEVRGVR